MQDIPKISDAEWEVMKLLWKDNPKTSEEIIESLIKKMGWTSQSIKTYLTRLVKKDVVTYKKEGRIYYYYPNISEKKCIRKESKTFIEKVYDGAVNMFVSSFISDRDLTMDEIDNLEKILKEKKNKIKKSE